MRFRTGNDRCERVPPGGWRVYLAQTDTEFGPSLAHWSEIKAEMLDHVRANREAFDIPDEDLEEWAEDLLCKQCQVEASHCTGQALVASPRTVTIGDVIRFLKVMGQWVERGFKLVDQKTADKRAAICASCPFNKSVRGCLSCQKLLTTVMEKLAGKKAALSHRLHNCDVCSCNLKALVWCPDEVLRGTSPEGAVYHPTCWKPDALSQQEETNPPAASHDESSP